MAKYLTARQREIFTYIQRRIKEGYPPTIREIGSKFGFSEKAAHDHLNALEKKKYIGREEGKPRAISILKEADPKLQTSKWLEGQNANPNLAETPRDIIEIPIFGRVAAGTPLLASQNIEGTLPIPTRMVNNHECFALRIIGSSMIGAGILEGDFVIVRRQANADQGDIVVALVEDEATVKRFYIEGEKVRLQPENPTIEPVIFSVNDVMILGKVIGLHREI
ncbi:transcriptional repressor LexA [Candidatus Poribacteria bacterium]|nr:transcriptional repressor LexA [Candidatus Poribacteria bacterium]